REAGGARRRDCAVGQGCWRADERAVGALTANRQRQESPGPADRALRRRLHLACVKLSCADAFCLPALAARQLAARSWPGWRRLERSGMDAPGAHSGPDAEAGLTDDDDAAEGIDGDVATERRASHSRGLVLSDDAMRAERLVA